mgnify:CR=1 FL=1
MANGRERRDGIGPGDKVAACFVGREGQKKKGKHKAGSCYMWMRRITNNIMGGSRR